MDNLRAFQPISDNVSIIVKPLECDDSDAQTLGIEKKGMKWFDTNCANIPKDKKKAGEDERPIIHVSSSDFYFNITKSAEFEDLIFDGINAFAYIEEINVSNKEIDHTVSLETLKKEAQGVSTSKLVGEKILIPYWPLSKCKLDDLFEKTDDSHLLELIKEKEEVSYGQIPMQALLDSRSYLLKDNTSEKQYILGCRYNGSKSNLFNNGAHELLEN